LQPQNNPEAYTAIILGHVTDVSRDIIGHVTQWTCDIASKACYAKFADALLTIIIATKLSSIDDNIDDKIASNRPS